MNIIRLYSLVFFDQATSIIINPFAKLSEGCRLRDIVTWIYFSSIINENSGHKQNNLTFRRTLSTDVKINKRFEA